MPRRDSGSERSDDGRHRRPGCDDRQRRALGDDSRRRTLRRPTRAIVSALALAVVLVALAGTVAAGGVVPGSVAGTAAGGPATGGVAAGAASPAPVSTGGATDHLAADAQWTAASSGGTPWVATSGDGSGSHQWAAASVAAPEVRTRSVTAAEADGTSATTESGERVRLVVGNASPTAGATDAFRLSLSRVPSGLSGFEATVELAPSPAAADGESGPVARFANASYPDRFAPTTRPAIGADGQSIAVEAADLRDRVRPGDANVTLATVVVRGESAGEVTASIDDASVVADGGDAVAVAPEAGTVSVVGSDASGSSSDSPGGATSDPSAAGASDGEAADRAPASTGGEARSLSLVHLGLLTALVLGSALLAVATSRRDG